ncbi:MAG: 2-dehydro-3-deoxygalactonokinase [Acidobacteria bacterium]|nr:2-dehydro-3-deoxygalactonokinase [Acidobacteriota bacterium]
MPTAPIAMLDVGSTNSRAWLVSGGTILRRAAASVGVRDSVRTGSTALLRQTVRQLIEQISADHPVGLVAAAGMITSPLGLADVPHVAAPASAQDLSAAAVILHPTDITRLPMLLVPGVRTGAAAASVEQLDVMRGEETLAVGLTDSGLLRRGGLLLTAGSHWKLIWTDADGRVAGSRTSLGGEIVHAVQTATLLNASLPSQPMHTCDREWLEAGAAAARKWGLPRAMFQVRLLDQSAAAGAAERLNWLVGACVAVDLDGLTASGRLGAGEAVLVTGPAAVPHAWRHLLQIAGCRAEVLDSHATEQAFVRGLSTVVDARRRELR